MELITIVNGVYKPTNITGGLHIAPIIHWVPKCLQDVIQALYHFDLEGIGLLSLPEVLKLLRGGR